MIQLSWKPAISTGHAFPIGACQTSCQCDVSSGMWTRIERGGMAQGRLLNAAGCARKTVSRFDNSPDMNLLELVNVPWILKNTHEWSWRYYSILKNTHSALETALGMWCGLVVVENSAIPNPGRCWWSFHCESPQTSSTQYRLETLDSNHSQSTQNCSAN